MKVVDWLLTEDASVERLTSRHLLDREPPYREDGLVARYVALQNPVTGLWSDAVYSPKWISTHYTMLELKSMEIDPRSASYQAGLRSLLDSLWGSGGGFDKRCMRDLCVAAMLLGLAAYGHADPAVLDGIVGRLLDHTMPDGGWNCSWDSTKTVKSSLHTTISVLEAFEDYLACGRGNRADDVRRAIPDGEEFVLKKRLFRSVSTGQVIRPDFLVAHYPPRWHYDAFRALLYFARVRRPFDERMGETLESVKQQMEKGWMAKGSQWGGLIHFPLETTRAGRFNTLRALCILRFYDPETFLDRMEKDVPTLDC